MIPGTFGAFETFRILIPGYFAALCGSWYVYLFFPRAAGYLGSSNLGGLTFAGFGLAAGLVLYLSHLPRDSREYKELQPSRHIYERAKAAGKPIELGDATETYFYVLNNYFPEAMRERIYYYGNIYRVAQKTWLISISFLILSAATQTIFCFLGKTLASFKGVIALDAVLLGLFLLLRWQAEKHAMQILRGQIKWLKMRDKLVESLIGTVTDPNASP
jgi:hypothetical protein